MRGIGTPRAHNRTAGRTLPARLAHGVREFAFAPGSVDAAGSSRGAAVRSRVDMMSTFQTKGTSRNSHGGAVRATTTATKRRHRAPLA